MNPLTLIIVNEGADYQRRLHIARVPNQINRFGHWADRVEREARRQRLSGDIYTLAQKEPEPSW